ncbi:MAG: FlgD immunoglobulin-like domain containing protein [bacterium]
MKRTWWFLACLAVMLFITPAWADQDPHDKDAADTVIVRPYSFVQATAPWPDSIGIPVEIWADDTVKAYNLGLKVTGPGAQYFRISSIDHDGPCEPAFNAPSAIYDWDSTTGVTFGWVDFTSAFPCLSPQGQLATVYLQVDPATPVGMTASLDSTFVAPASFFLFVLQPSYQVAPRFYNGASHGMPNILLGNAPPVVTPVTMYTLDAVDSLVDNTSGYMPIITMHESEVLSFEVTATDYEDALTDLAVQGTPPTNATFTVDGIVGTFTFSPVAGQGSIGDGTAYDVTFVATDDAANTGTYVVRVIVLQGGAVTDLESPVLPDQYSLRQNYPNPFNPTTTIDFAVPRSGDVRLEIFNVLGQSIRVLVDEYLSAGEKRVQWDGVDESGHPASSGVYLYRMTAEDFGQTRKMLLLK